MRKMLMKQINRMKKIILASAAALLLASPVNAQSYGTRTYNASTGQFEYSYNYGGKQSYAGSFYYGLRMGLSFSTVNSDDKTLDGGSSRTGLSLGAVAGAFLSNDINLIFETGLLYKEKGGRSEYEGKKMTYSLDYFQVPLIVKYSYVVDKNFSIQPFAGGYLAYGIGGKIKNYGDRIATNSFSKQYFKHFDGGLQLGCGIGYNLFYADLSYEIGLTNICRDEFDTSHNRCFSINVGVNF